MTDGGDCRCGCCCCRRHRVGRKAGVRLSARAARRKQQTRSVWRHGDRSGGSQTARILDALACARTTLCIHVSIRIHIRARARHGEGGRVEIVRQHWVLLALGVAQLLLRWLQRLRRLRLLLLGRNGSIGQQTIVVCSRRGCIIATRRETRRGRQQRGPQIGAGGIRVRASGSGSTRAVISRRRDACGVHRARLTNQQRDQLLFAQTRAQMRDGLGARKVRRQCVLCETTHTHAHGKGDTESMRKKDVETCGATDGTMWKIYECCHCTEGI